MDRLISEQAVLDLLIENGIYGYEKKIAELPSIQPKPQTGHWITHEEQFNALGIAIKGGVKCSECGYTTHNKLHMEIGCPYKYCPNCGVRMIEERSE